MKFRLLKESMNIEQNNALLDAIKSMGESGVLKILNSKPTKKVPHDTAVFINRNGDYIDVGDALSRAGVDYYDADHVELIDFIIYGAYSEYIRPNDSSLSDVEFYDWLDYDEYDTASYLMDDITILLGWVRANSGSTDVEDRLYFVIPNTANEKQLESVKNFLIEFENTKEEYSAFFIGGQYWRANYTFEDVRPERFLQIARRYIRTGQKPMWEKLIRLHESKQDQERFAIFLNGGMKRSYKNMKIRNLKESFDYFETEDAIYSITNGKHQYHLKDWDKNPSFKYHWEEIPVGKYIRAYRTEAINESFDRKDITIATVDWSRLQNIVNNILEKNGKDYYIQFSESAHEFTPHDVYIHVLNSYNGEVIDEEQLSARYFPGADVIQVFGGIGRREQKSPEEFAENISRTVDYYWYKER